jgi:hypothetical protein
VFKDPLIPILVFLAVTGMVLALASLRRANAGQVRVRILRHAGDGPLGAAAASGQADDVQPAR